MYETECVCEDDSEWHRFFKKSNEWKEADVTKKKDKQKESLVLDVSFFCCCCCCCVCVCAIVKRSA